MGLLSSNTMKTKLVIFSLLSASSSLHAAVISLNFQGGNGSGVNPSLMGAGETAGVVPAANWNNLSGANQGSAQALVDDSNTANAASVTWKLVRPFDTNSSDSAGNNRMMLGYLDTANATTTTVGVAGISSAFQSTGYDIYVYYDGGNGGIDRSGDTPSVRMFSTARTTPIPRLQIRAPSAKANRPQLPVGVATIWCFPASTRRASV